ncbi:ExbD/TolR family protein [Undibacterium sp. Ji83W]|uniref:ExbD/TolR family protein n=1 Tax=Undibacterium sp. Ji83W TaxID=3413043 RepID=UPI003BF276C3
MFDFLWLHQSISISNNMRHIHFISVMIAFAIASYAQASSAASKNIVVPAAASATVKTSSLTLTLTARGDYVISSDQDKSTKKTGKLGGFPDLDALEKNLHEMKNGASDVVLNIKTGRDVNFQYLVDVVSTMVGQTLSKFTVTTEAGSCTVQIPLDMPANNTAYLTVQISADGDYALQMNGSDGKLKGKNVTYRHEKMGDLVHAIEQAKKSNAGIYAFINADKNSPIQAYVDIVNAFDSATIEKHWLLVKSVANARKKSSEENTLRANEQRIRELAAQQKELLERVKNMSKR